MHVKEVRYQAVENLSAAPSEPCLGASLRFLMLDRITPIGRSCTRLPPCRILPSSTDFLPWAVSEFLLYDDRPRALALVAAPGMSLEGPHSESLNLASGQGISMQGGRLGATGLGNEGGSARAPCSDRCGRADVRLASTPRHHPKVLTHHQEFPLRRDLVHLAAIRLNDKLKHDGRHVPCERVRVG